MTNSKSFSFEFFPPQTQEGANKLASARRQLAVLKPAFFSVTFGAGGSTRERTLEAVQQIKADGYEAAPHLSCVGSTRENIRTILHTYKNMGIKRIVALRGDLPSGMATSGEFHYANELVSFIRAETGEHFHIEVAAYPEFHPQAKSPRDDLLNFKRKVMAGANSAITQYFYNADGYFRFVEECRKLGVTLPIVPGVMPIMKFSQLARFSDLCGAEIPRSIRKMLESYGDDNESVQAFGLDVVTQLCERLLVGGAPGLHFYTLNQSAPSMEIWKRLGL
ncbi:MAG: methylenetetrahydrofolate reductase [NAD(P)H] [Candidatus Nitrotoga sp.]|nr:methylenetetrahydrofolate reductase [NAD(P)H] [Candidatus Nitrotoga sp.]MDO9447921.1 methylenetetrahydrofolate reductase [NAD(P)H] [Candidatus Nitrotoga sp.]MDP1637646.1 methylenetetrahydrofolate reductase [NAD(P)H] [Candidatus Nitrotoga sp.]MDP1856252.1 methylenetetrahydrofolate reductase [NAD(P)H] [Candidatus Nitrotoga sp.]MDP3496130.1 methylenetetrahydrofolate reductase [NAD(P)H] [Candidatus Nitrotoga sp.]